MSEGPPTGWQYRLGPCLSLRIHRPPPGSATGERVLWVQPGGAFPPSHPATRLCLDLLREALAAQQAGTFLDVGCGSGVLTLAAAALGVPRVLGVDLSWEAVRATRDNARENGLAPPILAVQGSTQCLRGSFDLLAANLPVEVQRDKTAALHRLAAPQGRLILAGFRDNQEEQLLAGYLARGWRLGRRVVREFAHPTLPPDLSFTWAAWLLGRGSCCR